MSRYIDANKLIANLEKIEQELVYADGRENYLFAHGTLTGVRKAITYTKAQLTEDVVPSSEVEELQKKLNDYERVVGKLSFTVDGVATLLIGEKVEYIDKRVAEGLKNMAVKQAKQKVARELIKEIRNAWETTYYEQEFEEKLDNIEKRNT